MACGATPPTCPSLGTVPVNHRLSAHGDVLPRPNGFEALQTDLHGTSGTHGEYNHGRVQSLRHCGHTGHPWYFIVKSR